jgi:hypothetical protein
LIFLILFIGLTQSVTMPLFVVAAPKDLKKNFKKQNILNWFKNNNCDLQARNIWIKWSNIKLYFYLAN